MSVPYKYLGRLMADLSRGGFVDSVRGKNGGYQIKEPIGDIRLRDVIEAVEGLEGFRRCLLGFPDCNEEEPCPLHEHWKQHKQGIDAMIQDVTIEQLVAG